MASYVRVLGRWIRKGNKADDCGSRDANFQELHCMSFTNKDATELLVAGIQDTMFRIDVERGTISDIV